MLINIEVNNNVEIRSLNDHLCTYLDYHLYAVTTGILYDLFNACLYYFIDFIHVVFFCYINCD